MEMGFFVGCNFQFNRFLPKFILRVSTLVDTKRSRRTRYKHR